MLKGVKRPFYRTKNKKKCKISKGVNKNDLKCFLFV